MHNYADLLAKSKEWRDWYYDGAPSPNPITDGVTDDAFDLINATLFGHIYQRETLPTNIRSICTIAALIVLDKPNQLPGHITGALNYGWTKEQIVELITQMLFYGGFPACSQRPKRRRTSLQRLRRTPRQRLITAFPSPSVRPSQNQLRQWDKSPLPLGGRGSG